MKLVSTVALVLATFAIACEPAAAPPPVAPAPAPAPTETIRVTPDAPFRAQAPMADGLVQFTPPAIQTAKLKNGLRVFIVERHALPVVAVRHVVTLGAGDVAEARPGALNFVGAMLDKGTKKRTSLQLSDDLDAIGAKHSAGVEWDAGAATIRMVTEHVDTGLDLLAEMTLSPSFPNDEVERLRTQRLTAIAAEKNVPTSAAANAQSAALFGRSHAYGHALVGEEADVKALTRAELVKDYEKLFTVQSSALIVIGDVTKDAILPKLEARWGTWKAKGGFARKAPKALTKADTDKRLVLVDRAGAQSQVQVARLGAAYASKDRTAIQVANAILGGTFSSRINMNLREKNSYTYGARSSFALRHGVGPFSISGAIMADKTGPAIKEIFNELDSLKKDGPTDEELSLAKESLRLAMPARFETVAEVSAAVSELVIYDLPLDDFAQRQARLETVTKDDVKRIASEYFTAEQMTVVVVGGKDKVMPQLEPLNLGAVDERDAYGNPVGSAKPADKGAAPRGKGKKAKAD